MRRATGFSIVLLVAVLAGCDSTSLSSPLATADPDVATEDPIGDETDTPISPGGQRLAEFGEHLGESAPEAADIMTSFADVSTMDFARYLALAYDLRDWTKSEKTWLKYHPSHRCYRSMFTHYKNAVTGFDRAALLMIAGIPKFDVKKINAAVAVMKKAKAAVDKANSALAPTVLRCA
jgi:hypothetical protein